MSTLLYAGCLTATAIYPELVAILDDGTQMTIVGTQTIGLGINDVKVDSNGKIYVAYGTKVDRYTYASGTFTLDTSWGTAGSLNVGYTVRRIAIDPTDRGDGNGANCVAVAHLANAATKILSLYNGSGSLIWASTVLVGSGTQGTNVGFRASDGDVVIARSPVATAGSVILAMAKRLDGTLRLNLNTSGSGGTSSARGFSLTTSYIYSTRMVETVTTDVVRKLDWSGGLQWESPSLSANTIYDVLYWGGAVYAGVDNLLYKLSDVDGTVVTSTDFGALTIYRILDYGSNLLVASNSSVLGSVDGKTANIRVLDSSLNVLRRLYLPGCQCVAVGPTTTDTVTVTRVWIGGNNFVDIRLWTLLDNGTSLSCTDSLSTTDLDANVNAIKYCPQLDKLYVATALKVRRYNAVDLTLDTAWAVSGVRDLTGDITSIWDIDVDSSGFLAIAADDGSAPKAFSALFNASGVEVWRYTNASLNGGRSVSFYPNGDLLVGYACIGGTVNILRRHQRSDGTVLQQGENSASVNDRVFGVSSENDASDHATWAWSDAIQPAYVRYGTSAFAALWSTALGANYLYHSIVLGSSVYVGGYKTIDAPPYYTLWKLDKSNGAVQASYQTSAVVNDFVRKLRASTTLIYAAGTLSANQDSKTVSVSVFDTNLAFKYGFSAGVGTFTLDGAFGLPPTITDESTGADVAVGDTVNLYVVATGTEPLSYQWYKDGNLIGSATASTYSFTAAGASSGTYYCIVTNAVGTDQSSNMVIRVAPNVLTATGGGTVFVVAPASFVVVAEGLTPLSYQWYKGVSLIGGATLATYTIASTALADTGLYRCQVTNAVGSVFSANISLTVTEHVPTTENLFDIPSDLSYEG